MNEYHANDSETIVETESFWEKLTKLSREGRENLDGPIANEEIDSMIKNGPCQNVPSPGFVLFFNLFSLK